MIQSAVLHTAGLLSVCLLSLIKQCSNYSVIVKRDTVEEIRQNIADSLGIKDDENLMKRLQETEIDATKYCIQDKNCGSGQYCDKENFGLYGTCSYTTALYAGVGSGVSLVLLGILLAGGLFYKKRANRRREGGNDNNDNGDHQPQRSMLKEVSL